MVYIYNYMRTPLFWNLRSIELHNFNSNNRIYLSISMCVGSGNWNNNNYLLEINKVYLENFPRFKLLEDEVTQRYF